MLNSYTKIKYDENTALTNEGATLKNCVASYHQSCVSGSCSIWSLRQQTGGMQKSLVTMQVNEHGRIVQARGKHNAQPPPEQLKVIRL